MSPTIWPDQLAACLSVYVAFCHNGLQHRDRTRHPTARSFFAFLKFWQLHVFPNCIASDKQLAFFYYKSSAYSSSGASDKPSLKASDNSFQVGTVSETRSLNHDFADIFSAPHQECWSNRHLVEVKLNRSEMRRLFQIGGR